MSLVRPSALNTLAVPVAAVCTALFLAISPVSAACGNGVVEAGEDCDDGSTQNGGANSCCTTACTFSGESPDVIVGDLVGTTRWGTVGGITAYSVGTTSCNLGSCWLNWISTTAEHPVIGQNMFRLKDGRFEQIGQSWLKHGFTALTGSICASCVPPPSGAHLGVNCSDPYDTNLNGQQTRLGPKDDTNPNTGVFLFPDARESTSGDLIFKRLQVHNTDLDPTVNVGAVYFVEGQYVTHDDASAKNNANNASYRPVTVSVAAGPIYNITLTGSTVRTKAGILAWKAVDPTVTETTVAAAEGLFLLSAKATSLGGGQYHYEYAVENFSNQRAGQSFTVPIPAGTTVTNVGFHDVDYHSGTPYVGTDWTPTVGATSVSWASETFAVNQNANALRWGTLYNFRFDANVAPGTGSIVIGLFRPGAPTSASALSVIPNPCVSAPNGTSCNDSNPCTLSDACQSGVCQGTNPVVCTPSDACHVAGTCDITSGACSNPAAPNGSPCSDSNSCTQTDTCQGGSCSGSNPVVCTASDTCHNVGTCAPATGVCSNPAKPNGSVCNDGNACTQTDTCQTGACSGSNNVFCTASDVCHDPGTCAPATGLCSNPAKPNGSFCSDNNECTDFDTCQSGACASGAPVVCNPLDQCHDAGTCAPATGACSNPPRTDGSACDDANACTTNDACAGGVCAGTGNSAPSEVDANVQVAQSGGISTISWNVALGSTTSSVLRGLVTGLPVGPGGGDEVCLASGMAGNSAIDSDTPNPDEAFWYLVQGANDCGKGPYGSQVVDGVPAPRVSATCP